MRTPAFVGDELSAAGFRLAGARVHTPAPGQEASVLQQALRESAFVLITAEVATRIAPAIMNRVLASAEPLVIVVPDVRQRCAPTDLGRAVRAQLGME
ncbi:MAG TPA: V-type ATP synthase subunit F [Rhodocyclaceae bacterium]|nr:V-type ATP synthase subunit F [Rhodocyclaceae bacterium]